MSFNVILSSLNQTITLYPPAVQDKFGKTTYSAGTDYACRFQRVTKNILTATNEFTPITALIWLGPDTPVAIGDKVTFGTDDYKVMTVEEEVDKYGHTRHYECAAQSWNL